MYPAIERQRWQKRLRYCERLVGRILAAWGISGSPLEWYDLGGAYNVNWRVITPQDDVVIRIRPTWTTVERLRDVHQLLQRLNARGLLTSLPLPARNGESFVSVDQHWVELYNYLPEAGDRQWSAARWLAGFRHMQVLHQKLNEVAAHIVPPIVSNYVPPALALRLLEETQAKIAALPPSHNRPEALAICREALEVMEHVANYFAALEQALPVRLVHGDFHLSNLLFNAQNEVAYTLDFDFMGWRERLYEIAYALRLALPQLTDNSQHTLNLDLIRLWLNAYDDQNSDPLTPQERAALPYQLAQVALLYLTVGGIQQGNPLWVVLRESAYVELACYLVRNPQALAF